MDFGYGNDSISYGDIRSYVRAVRDGQSKPLNNFALESVDAVGSGLSNDVSAVVGGYTDNRDGTVTDTSTGLMWQAGSSDLMTWEQALAYCEGLNLGGYSDWRLVTKKELRSLVDFSRYNPSINTTYFPNTQGSFYWSSTTIPHKTDYAFTVNFYSGYDGYNSIDDFGYKLSYHYARAVRGGQIPTSTGCTVTLDNNLLFHIPYLTYVNPILGIQSLWADFVYEFNPTYPTFIYFKLTNAAMLPNYTYLCSASILSDDFKIFIPDVLLMDGSTHLWMELEYSSAFSTDENTYFLVTNYGVISN